LKSVAISYRRHCVCIDFLQWPRSSSSFSQVHILSSCWCGKHSFV